MLQDQNPVIKYPLKQCHQLTYSLLMIQPIIQAMIASNDPQLKAPIAPMPKLPYLLRQALLPQDNFLLPPVLGANFRFNSCIDIK